MPYVFNPFTGKLDFTNGASAVNDSDVIFTDITDGNASISKHGFLPKLSGSSSQFLNGAGNYITPSGIVNSYLAQSFSSVTSVNVTHGFGTFPVVQVVDNTGAVLIPLSIVNNSINDLTVTFSVAKTGNVLLTVGSPQFNAISTITGNYTTTMSDNILSVTSENVTITLQSAVGIDGKEFTIKNHSNGVIYVNTTLGELIDIETEIMIDSYDSRRFVSEGAHWLII